MKAKSPSLSHRLTPNSIPQIFMRICVYQYMHMYFLKNHIFNTIVHLDVFHLQQCISEIFSHQQESLSQFF